jgi:hypothetical protein
VSNHRIIGATLARSMFLLMLCQKYWLPGGIVWILERIMREVRCESARHIILSWFILLSLPLSHYSANREQATC